MRGYTDDVTLADVAKFCRLPRRRERARGSRRPVRKIEWLAAFSLVVLSVLPPLAARADAGPRMLETNPRKNQVLRSAPTDVFFRFNSPIARFGTATFVNGVRTSTALPHRTSNPNEAVLPLGVANPSAAGRYQIFWEAFTEDGTGTSGQLKFLVSPTAPTSPTGLTRPPTPAPGSTATTPKATRPLATDVPPTSTLTGAAVTSPVESGQTGDSSTTTVDGPTISPITPTTIASTPTFITTVTPTLTTTDRAPATAVRTTATTTTESASTTNTTTTTKPTTTKPRTPATEPPVIPTAPDPTAAVPSPTAPPLLPISDIAEAGPSGSTAPTTIRPTIPAPSGRSLPRPSRLPRIGSTTADPTVPGPPATPGEISTTTTSGPAPVITSTTPPGPAPAPSSFQREISRITGLVGVVALVGLLLGLLATLAPTATRTRGATLQGLAIGAAVAIAALSSLGIALSIDALPNRRVTLLAKLIGGSALLCIALSRWHSVQRGVNQVLQPGSGFGRLPFSFRLPQRKGRGRHLGASRTVRNAAFLEAALLLAAVAVAVVLMRR